MSRILSILVGLIASLPLRASPPSPTAMPDQALLDVSKAITRIAFGSCFDQNMPTLSLSPFGPRHDIWDTIVEAGPDLMLLLGDNIYAKTEDMAVMRREYAKLAADAGFRRLRRSVPILATWDDNDYGKSDGGAEYPRKRESQSIFLEFFNEPKDSPRWTRAGVYDAKVVGPPGRRVQIILLDTRYFRGPLVWRPHDQPAPPDRPGPYVPTTDTSATMLGETQWRWLAEQLRVPADLRIIASSIEVVAEDHGYEKWANFPHERARLFKLIGETKVGGVLIISGDRHSAELSRIDAGVGYPLYDLTSSSLNKPRLWAIEANQHRVGEMYFGANFGMVSIDWDRPDPLIRLQIHGTDGKTVFEHEVSLRELRSTPEPRPGP